MFRVRPTDVSCVVGWVCPRGTYQLRLKRNPRGDAARPPPKLSCLLFLTGFLSVCIPVGCPPSGYPGIDPDGPVAQPRGPHTACGARPQILGSPHCLVSAGRSVAPPCGHGGHCHGCQPCLGKSSGRWGPPARQRQRRHWALVLGQNLDFRHSPPGLCHGSVSSGLLGSLARGQPPPTPPACDPARASLGSCWRPQGA